MTRRAEGQELLGRLVGVLDVEFRPGKREVIDERWIAPPMWLLISGGYGRVANYEHSVPTIHCRVR